jgi:hypothetical protein
MSTRELIDAIEANDSITIQTTLEKVLSSRIAEKLDVMRQEVAKNMFQTEAVSGKKSADMAKVNAGAMSKADFDAKWKSPKKKGLAGPGGVYKNMVKEDEDLDEAKDPNAPKPSEIHIKDHPDKPGHFKVHAVGKKWKEHINAGDTLNDSELDDFAEVGGKIKHLGD